MCYLDPVSLLDLILPFLTCSPAIVAKLLLTVRLLLFILCMMLVAVDEEHAPLKAETLRRPSRVALLVERLRRLLKLCVVLTVQTSLGRGLDVAERCNILGSLGRRRASSK